jgi:hypothetical protein
MQPAFEPHYRLARHEGVLGNVAVEKIACARVYHLNLVIRVSTAPKEAQQALLLHTVRVVMDQGGIKRLESQDLAV